MVRDMILLVHDRCMWPRTHPGCAVTHQNVSRVLGKALKIFATIVTLKTIVQCTDAAVQNNLCNKNKSYIISEYLFEKTQYGPL